MELWKGSANTQLSILRRKKVLAINKSKIELATQPLPNAKKLLFGEDFPSIASKEAELSRGLAKNLAPVPKLPKTKPGYGSRVPASSNNHNVFSIFCIEISLSLILIIYSFVFL
jgi:hypothetical protein